MNGPPVPQVPSGFTVVPMRVVMDVDLGLPDAQAAQLAYVAQWIADHLAMSVSLSRAVVRLDIEPRPGALLRRG